MPHLSTSQPRKIEVWSFEISCMNVSINCCSLKVTFIPVPHSWCVVIISLNLIGCSIEFLCPCSILTGTYAGLNRTMMKLTHPILNTIIFFTTTLSHACQYGRSRVKQHAGMPIISQQCGF